LQCVNTNRASGRRANNTNSQAPGQTDAPAVVATLLGNYPAGYFISDE
jgi:hypothetical protein